MHGSGTAGGTRGEELIFFSLLFTSLVFTSVSLSFLKIKKVVGGLGKPVMDVVLTTYIRLVLASRGKRCRQPFPSDVSCHDSLPISPTVNCPPPPPPTPLRLFLLLLFLSWNVILSSLRRPGSVSTDAVMSTEKLGRTELSSLDFKLSQHSISWSNVDACRDSVRNSLKRKLTRRRRRLVSNGKES